MRLDKNPEQVEKLRGKLIALVKLNYHSFFWGAQQEEKIREINKMTDDEVFDALEYFTMNRPVISHGGALATLVFFLVCNPYAKFYTRFFFPTYLVLPIVLAAELIDLSKHYTTTEISISLLPSFAFPLMVFVLNRSKFRIFKHEQIMNILSNKSKPIIINQDTKLTSKLTIEQINAMKKRNEKFHNKNRS